MLRHLGFLMVLFALAACSTGRQPVAVAPAPCAQVGMASWYRPGGHHTADGDRARQDALIAAHRSLPFGTQVRVTDLDSGRSVVVRIDDRGPFVHGRIIDLSPAAAKRLGMRQDGVASVRLELPSGAPAGAACPFSQAGST